MVAQLISADTVQYTTLGVSRATGIPATTILAWERRYGLPRPRRGDGGRRMYSEADASLLLAMRRRTADGVRAEMAARELLAANGGELPPPRPCLTYLPTEIKDVHCLHCGEATGELQVQYAPAGPQARFVITLGASHPQRGDNNRPRCGRCNGDLFIEPRESRALPPFQRPAGPTSVRGAA